MSTTSYLILGRILPQIGKRKTLASKALERPLGSMTTGRSLRACSHEERGALACALSPPECSWGWLYCCWASPDGSQVHAKGMTMYKWQKSFLLRSRWFCAVKLDVIKLIKPEIRSCNYYLIIRLQRWPHWYSLHFALDAEHIIFGIEQDCVKSVYEYRFFLSKKIITFF